MKPHYLTSLLCTLLGLALLAAGLFVPAHLRALDTAVVQSAAWNSQTALGEARMLANAGRLGAAQLLLQAAPAVKNPDTTAFRDSLTNAVQRDPLAFFWGADTLTQRAFNGSFRPGDQNLRFTDFVIRQENREAALARLQASSDPAVQALLPSRLLKDTVIFSPAQSAAGQPFDAAVCIAGLLLDGRHLTSGLSEEIMNAATQAQRGNSSQPLEQMLMDFLSLGQRLNWDQLTVIVAQVPDAGALHQLADVARGTEEKLPVLFGTVELSGKPAAVAGYLAKFPDTGWADLTASLGRGAGGVNELLLSQHRLHESAWIRSLAAYEPFGNFYETMAGVTFRHPGAAFAIKWVFYLLAGFLLALALHCALPAVSALERPLRVPGFHFLREFLFALGFLLVVLLLSEPFLAQDNPKEHFSFRLALPTVGGAVPVRLAGIQQTIMNPTILLTLLVFFVLQALLYISCLVKLAEIRRQNVPPRIKLKLLENEDHLFDAGLYLGFVGTIASLIIASLGLVHFSLMAAYSSTSFGIIFVVIFKIFHLRPARRKLLMEAERTPDDPAAPATPAQVMPS